jgi:hypothetical protein
MRKKVLQILVMVLAACPVVALAQAPKDGVYISDEDVKAVLKYAVDTKRTIVDNTIRVIDMNKYQLGVAVIHRGAMTGGGGANTAAAATNPAPACGEQRPGATGPNGIFHDDIGQRDPDYWGHRGQREAFCTRQRSDDNPERPVLQRHNRWIHEP